MTDMVHGVYTPYEAFIPPQRISSKELAFRRRANLCMHCGMAPRVPGFIVCFTCAEDNAIETARQEQRAWGVAA